MKNKLSNYVNDFMHLKNSKSNYTNEQYIAELEKLKSSLFEILDEKNMITDSEEEYLQSILNVLSIRN